MTDVPGRRPDTPGSIPAKQEAGAERHKSVEDLIRDAHRLLAVWHVSLSPSRVTRLCRDYHRTAAGKIAFERYMLNNADLSDAQRVCVQDELDRLMRQAPCPRKPTVRKWQLGESGWRIHT